MNQYHKTNPVNDKYFSIIDTQNKAYILGLLLADGHVEKNRNGVSLSLSGERDKYILQEIVKELFINDYELCCNKKSRKNSHHNDAYMFWLSSKQISSDLISFGFSNKKTERCEFEFSKIPPNLFPHFLRGFFDGDGSIFVTKYNSVNVHFVGLPNIIRYIHSYLKNNDIVSAIYPCYSSHTVNELRIGNIHEIKKFYDLIYKDAVLFLERKKSKFEYGFDILKSELNRKFTSRFIGVCFDKNRNKWKAAISLNNKPINIGRFNTENEAAIAYNLSLIHI